ncbi:MAG TPA: hypothetical protein VE338_06860 [Ktedonobacterales bacterium]|nr:hypothetical protein [Ktedonobacterales bacterium]
MQTAARNGNGNGAPGGARQPNEIIRPKTDETYRLQVETTPEQAHEVSGAYGPQWMYFFAGGKLIYADANMHQAMTAAAPESGDELAITRARGGKWLIERVSTSMSRGGASVHYADSAAAFPPPHKPLPSAAEAEAGRRALDAELTRQHQLTAKQQQMAAHRPVASVTAARLMECYSDAIDVAIHASTYAKECGLLITPTYEDIRCMAATLHIDRTRAEIGGRQ